MPSHTGKSDDDDFALLLSLTITEDGGGLTATLLQVMDVADAMDSPWFSAMLESDFCVVDPSAKSLLLPPPKSAFLTLLNDAFIPTT
jgi:hypothetical protein